jgi:hypothetical protein
MEACYGGADVMERSCAVARGIDTNSIIRSQALPCCARNTTYDTRTGININTGVILHITYYLTTNRQKYPFR